MSDSVMIYQRIWMICVLVIGITGMTVVWAMDNRPMEASQPIGNHSKNALITLLYEGDSIRQRVANLPQYTTQLLASERAQYTQQAYQNVKVRLTKIIDIEQLHIDAEIFLAQQLSLQEIQGILQWLESSLGRALIKVENDIAADYRESTPQNTKAVVIPTVATERRKTMLRHLDQATVTSQTAAYTLFYLMQTIFVATEINQATLSPQKLQTQLQQQTASLPALLTTIKQQTHQQFLKTYQSVTDRSLQKYLTFAQSSVGKKYYQAVSQTLVNTAQWSLEKLLKNL